MYLCPLKVPLVKGDGTEKRMASWEVFLATRKLFPRLGSQKAMVGGSPGDSCPGFQMPLPLSAALEHSVPLSGPTTGKLR